MNNNILDGIHDSLDAYNYVHYYMINHPDTPVPYYNDMLQLVIKEQHTYVAYYWAVKIRQNIPEMANIVISSNDPHIAFHWANKVETNIPEMAQIIIQNKNSQYAGKWMKYIKTHMDDMFNVIINSADLNTFCLLINELKYEYDMELNKALRQKIVELGLVDDFVERYQLRIDGSYSFNNFYNGLSNEYQVGAII